MGELHTITEAARTLFGREVSVHSVRRWIAQGVGRPRVKLPAKRIAGRYYVSRSDAEEFLQAVSDPELYRRRKRTERVRAAEKRLLEAGA